MSLANTANLDYWARHCNIRHVLDIIRVNANLRRDALHLAARHDCRQLVFEILARYSGSTLIRPPVSQAAAYGRLELLRELVDGQYRANPSVDQNLPLRHAARYGHMRIVEYILNHPRMVWDDGAFAAIRIAADSGHEAIAFFIHRRALQRIIPSPLNFF